MSSSGDIPILFDHDYGFCSYFCSYLHPGVLGKGVNLLEIASSSIARTDIPSLCVSGASSKSTPSSLSKSSSDMSFSALLPLLVQGLGALGPVPGLQISSALVGLWPGVGGRGFEIIFLCFSLLALVSMMPTSSCFWELEVPPSFESEPPRDWFILPEVVMGWFCQEMLEGELRRIPKASWTDLSFSMFTS